MIYYSSFPGQRRVTIKKDFIYAQMLGKTEVPYFVDFSAHSSIFKKLTVKHISNFTPPQQNCHSRHCSSCNFLLSERSIATEFNWSDLLLFDLTATLSSKLSYFFLIFYWIFNIFPLSLILWGTGCLLGKVKCFYFQGIFLDVGYIRHITGDCPSKFPLILQSGQETAIMVHVNQGITHTMNNILWRKL